MTKCPKCSRGTRMHVSVYMDLPSSMAHDLSKTAIRSKSVRLVGAGWPTATYYCECGWFLRLGKGTG